MLIYGRNATGKTNLGRALLDIGLIIFGGLRYAGNGIYSMRIPKKMQQCFNTNLDLKIQN